MHIASLPLDSKIGYYHLMSHIVQLHRKHSDEFSYHKCVFAIEPRTVDMIHTNHNLSPLGTNYLKKLNVESASA